MELKRFSVEAECHKIWERMSENTSLWETWWANRALFDPRINEFAFYVFYEGGKEIGLIPLQYEKGLDYYCFFGGLFPEQRCFFFKDESDMPAALDLLKKEGIFLQFDYLMKDYGIQMAEDDSNFMLDIGRYVDLESYLGSFSKKHRKNLKYDLRQLERFRYIIKPGEMKDLDRVIGFLNRRFGTDSSFMEDGFEDDLKRLLEEAQKRGALHMISIEINGLVEAAGFAVLHGPVYHLCCVGSNADIKNLGKLLIVEHIKLACQLKAKKIDFMSHDSGWKRLWNLTELPQYHWTNRDVSDSS